jgi:glycogen synthase kinase 3 beta
VIAEMITGRPFFLGDSSTNQIIEIIKIIGTPTEEEVMSMNSASKEFRFPKVKALTLKSVLKNYCDLETIQFLEKVFVYNPAVRYSAKECMLHPYFNELRVQDTRLPSGKSLNFDLILNFSDTER